MSCRLRMTRQVASVWFFIYIFPWKHYLSANNVIFPQMSEDYHVEWLYELHINMEGKPQIASNAKWFLCYVWFFTPHEWRSTAHESQTICYGSRWRKFYFFLFDLEMSARVLFMNLQNAVILVL